MRRLRMDQNPAFWAAFWAGLSGPAMLYEPPAPYYLYLSSTNVAQAFGTVGMYLDQTSGSGRKRTRSDAAVCPVSIAQDFSS